MRTLTGTTHVHTLHDLSCPHHHSPWSCGDFPTQQVETLLRRWADEARDEGYEQGADDTVAEMAESIRYRIERAVKDALANHDASDELTEAVLREVDRA